MTYDGSDRKHIRAAEKAAKIREAARRNFIRQIMQSFDGRAWMHDLLDRCHMWHTPFAAGQTDVTSFRCGESNIGLQIFNDVVTIASNEYVLMMQEATAKEIIDDRRYSGSEPVAAEPTGRGPDTGRDDQGHEPDAGADEAPTDGWVN